MAKAITIEGLKREIGDEGKARDVYKKISIGFGFGNVITGFHTGPPPLDINSLSESDQARIAEMIETAKGKAEEAKTEENSDSDTSKSTKKVK
jgi:hypothetical protein